MSVAWRGRAHDPFVVGALSGGFYTWLAARDDILGNLSDGAIYLLMADVLSPWHAAPHALGSSLFRDYAFPPLYPALLALLGGGSAHLGAAYAAHALTMALMMAAVHAWFASVVEQRLQAWLLSGVFALLPITLLTGLAIQSEALYVALSFAGFTLLERDHARPRRVLLAGTLFGLGVLVRTVGISLVVTALFGLLRVQRERRFHLALILILPGLAWFALRMLLGGESNYAAELLRPELQATLMRLLEHAHANLASAPSALISMFGSSHAPHMQLSLALLAGFAALGWTRRLLRGQPDAIYAVVYLAIIALWPFPQHLARFLFVVMPLFLFYAHAGVAVLAARVPTRALGALIVYAYFSVAALLITPGAYAIVAPIASLHDDRLASYVRSPQWHHYATPQRAVASLEDSAAMLESLRGIDEHLPADACVSSTVTPYALFYGRRRARPLAPNWVNRRTLLRQLESCPYVFMLAATQWPVAGYPAMYPYAKLKDRLEVIEVKLWQRGASRGQVMTMLGRVRTKAGPDHARD